MIILDGSSKSKEVTLRWGMLKHDQGKEEHARIHAGVEKGTNVH